jgi:hypothetical protein
VALCRYLGILILSARSDAQGADWREVSRMVLHIDPEQESDRARRAFVTRDHHAEQSSVLGTCFWPLIIIR